MQFKHIIAAIDVSDDLAVNVLRAADSLARRDSANIRVVSVWPAPGMEASAFATDIGVSSAVASQAALELYQEGRANCQKRLGELVEKYAPGAGSTILDGDASEAVSEFAQKVDADLIVTGSHQRGFWGTLFQGSASHQFIHDAPCAVLVITKAYAAKMDL